MAKSKKQALSNPDGLIFVRLICLIAGELGDGWSPEFDDDNVRAWRKRASIMNADGRGIYLLEGHSCRGSVSRLEISGVWPTWRGQKVVPSDREIEGRTSITVARGKSAAAIAGDIRRRLLPAYSELYFKMKARADGWLEEFNKRAAAIERIAKALNVAVKLPGENSNSDIVDIELALQKGDSYTRISLKPSFNGTETELFVRYAPTDFVLDAVRRLISLLDEDGWDRRR